MSSIKLKGSSSGDVTITVPAAAGTNTVTIPAATGTLPLSNLDHVTNRQNAKPLIINGDMTVNQRGDVTAGTTTGFFALDRWRFDLRGGFNINVTQSTDVPSGYGFGNSIKLDCNVEDTSPDANGLLLFQQIFEGQDLQLLNYGTSSAQKLTIAFWVKCTKTGTFQVNLRDEDSRHIGQLVTINSANTWEKKVFSFDGDTAGAIANSNASSIRLQIFLDAGSDNSGGGVPSSWAAVNESKSFNGNLAFGQANANEIFFTGVQLEVGEFDANSIAPFQHESFADSLLRCQRYLYDPLRGTSDTFGSMAHGFCLSTTVAATVFETPVEMRAVPTIVTSGDFEVAGDSFGPTITAFNTFGRTGTRSMEIRFTVSSGLSSGEGAIIRRENDADAAFRLDAEL